MDEIEDFADEVVTYVMNELEGGSDWYRRWDALSHGDKMTLLGRLSMKFQDMTLGS